MGVFHVKHVGEFVKTFVVPGDTARRGGYLNVVIPWLRTPWYYFSLVHNRLHPQKRLYCPVDEWRRLMDALS